MKDKEVIEYSTYTDSSDIIHIKATHLPTNTRVEGSGISSYLLKQVLLRELDQLLSIDNNDYLN